MFVTRTPLNVRMYVYVGMHRKYRGVCLGGFDITGFQKNLRVFQVNGAEPVIIFV